jgi:DNA-binding response OmpR family regulator
VMVTGRINEADRAACFMVGAVGCLPKPYVAEELLAAADWALRSVGRRGFPPRLPIPYSLSLRTSFAFRRATQSGPMDPPTRTLSIFHFDAHCRLFVRIF